MKRLNPRNRKYMDVFFSTAVILSAFLYGCSLNYGQASQAQILSPEFVFRNARFTRTEHNKIRLQMEAEKLEQYSGLDAMYGQNVRFILYDETEKPSVTGSCFLFSADRENGMYHFFSNIHIKSTEHRAEISAQTLRWNEDTEVLDSAKDDLVRVSLENKDGSCIQIEGKGFSAKRTDLSFGFEKQVSGILEKVHTDSENLSGAEKTETPGNTDE